MDALALKVFLTGLIVLQQTSLLDSWKKECVSDYPDKLVKVKSVSLKLKTEKKTHEQVILGYNIASVCLYLGPYAGLVSISSRRYMKKASRNDNLLGMPYLN